MGKGGRRLASLTLLSSVIATGVALATPAASATTPHTFYVSSTGQDSADGMSPATAWRTLSPVNSHNLAGDTVLLEGGATFAGPINLTSSDTGVTVGSFGSGWARIASQGTSGVVGDDISGLTVRNLDLVGDAAAFASASGINLYNDLQAGQRLAGVTISDIKVTGFKDGVAIGGANPGAGFAQVSITNVTAVGNRDDGVITYGPAFNAAVPSYANADVQVFHTVANRNLGNPADRLQNTGNGIVLGSVDGGSITRSSASGNGARCAAPEGAAGIWTYDSRNIRITYDKATGNRTGGPADGDGFDLDQNVSDSVLEHDTSSGNDGAGFLVYTAQNNSANHGNVVRWNTSHGDAMKSSWYGGITVSGRVGSLTVSDNLVDMTASATRAPALSIKSGVTGLRIDANTLKSANNSSVVVSPRVGHAAATITRNRWSTRGAQRVQWGSARFRSVAAWTKATGES